MPMESDYTLTISLNVLNHLGLNLYSNVPAVISEVVANSWDADAHKVEITIDKPGGRIVIKDNGNGMTKLDINRKYLFVGYQKRKEEDGDKTPEGRIPMGRKGIGKLSLFSIARKVELHSIKDGHRNGFVMDADDIKRTIEEQEKKGEKGRYHPTPVPPNKIEIKKGTLIILTELKAQRMGAFERGLRKRIARRFSIIGQEHKFRVFINNKEVTIKDREYFHKLQYFWHYGKGSEYLPLCKNCSYNDSRKATFVNDTTREKLEIWGWIGTVQQPGELKEGKGKREKGKRREDEESLNKIGLMVREKLAQEDILEEFGEAGVYAEYIIGEIHADFLDRDDMDDITTSSRQKIIEDDPRYKIMKDFIYKELKHIQSIWTDLRNKEGIEKAIEMFPAIKEWMDGLGPDKKKYAKTIFGKIHRIRTDSDVERRTLFVQAILAFEKMKYKENLDALEKISAENISALKEIFFDFDDLEATMYHDITRGRIKIVEELYNKVDEKAKEAVIQKYLFDHLWLLDTSWERATSDEFMEKSMPKLFEDVKAKLTAEEKRARIDIKYRKTTGTHVIVELKKPDRRLSSLVLAKQIDKYRKALIKLLSSTDRKNEPYEFICVVGKDLTDWKTPDEMKVSKETLAARNARVFTYEQLIDSAYKSYQEYLAKTKDKGRIFNLIKQIAPGMVPEEERED